MEELTILCLENKGLDTQKGYIKILNKIRVRRVINLFPLNCIELQLYNKELYYTCDLSCFFKLINVRKKNVIFYLIYIING